MRLRLWPVLLLLVAAVALGACGEPENPDAMDGPVLTDDEQFTTTASGLRYRDLRVGDGPTPEAGDMVRVHYTGLADRWHAVRQLPGRGPGTFRVPAGTG